MMLLMLLVDRPSRFRNVCWILAAASSSRRWKSIESGDGAVTTEDIVDTDGVGVVCVGVDTAAPGLGIPPGTDEAEWY